MLQTLNLKNFVIVRELELEFRAGLTVLTGVLFSAAALAAAVWLNHRQTA